MRIGITCYPTYGGSGVLATELGKLLARRGHEVHFITSSLPYRLQMGFMERIYFHEVEVMSYPPFDNTLYNLALAAKMKEIYTEENLDVLHVHYALPHAISAYLAAQMVLPKMMPIVTTLHGTDITVVGQEKSLFDITRLGINQSTEVTAVSQYLQRETVSVFHPTQEVHTIYNFVDTDLFAPRVPVACRSILSCTSDVVYTHLSNFRKVKRIPDVIQTFYRIQKEIKSILLMVGEGPMYSEARELVHTLGIESKVKFLGKQDDVATILNLTDVLLFPSEVESFGLAALEAMSCEVPVIGSISGGIPEVVEHGVTGFLAPVGHVDEMARAGVLLGQNADLRKQMGRAGRERALKLFHPDQIIPQYEAIYQSAIEKAN